MARLFFRMVRGGHASHVSQRSRRDGIPLRLVAILDGELAGTIVLRQQAMDGLPEYRPGLGGLLVMESFRCQGIGTTLVQAGMDAAQQQGFNVVYATTSAAAGILTRLGWTQLNTVFQNSEPHDLYECKLTNNDSP
jgi:predicted N-acetyltransferase YhbS